jgi:hypothetical protein
MGALARLLTEVDDKVRSAVRLAVAEALKDRDSPDGISLIGSIWLISARA